jgi:cathepsin F
MQKYIALIFLFTLTVCVPEEYYKSEFAKFKQKFNKSYNANENSRRYNIFKQNLAKASQIQDPHASYGVTKFSDLTEDEFSQYYLKYIDPKKSRNSARNVLAPDATSSTSSLTDITPTVVTTSAKNWKDSGYVTPIKDQGACGSCYAFSALGMLESQYAKNNGGKIIDLSEQQIITCDTLDYGCNGGYMENVYKYLQKVGGAVSETSLPYNLRSKKCQLTSRMAKLVQVVSYTDISTNEIDIANTLSTYGPITTAINGNILQVYNNGIISSSSCSLTLNHAVILIGYGPASDGSGTDYWIVKNSWGTGWGESGFFRIQRGVGRCGINLNASTAIIK